MAVRWRLIGATTNTARAMPTGTTCGLAPATKVVAVVRSVVVPARLEAAVVVAAVRVAEISAGPTGIATPGSIAMQEAEPATSMVAVQAS